MTTDSASPTPRFRTAHVSEAGPEARLEQLLHDDERFWEVAREELGSAARTGDWALVLRLAAVGARLEDRHRAYAIQRLAATVLLAATAQLPRRAGDWSWTAPFDAMVELLVPVLDATPHEPALLDLLGVAVYELGHTKLARHLFEAVRELEPEDADARAHLRACRDRLAAPNRPEAVAEARTPAFARSRAHVKRIAERATQLADRTISVCMIVKDEEELLPGCLAAVAPHVDQLVVVDTGSTDRTREIAAEHGALVVEFAWNGSFSDARNESLRHATGDWVLWLDADEHLVAADGPRLRELARRTWVEAYHVVETHFMGVEEEGGSATHTPVRLFQRRPEYHWRGRVHEQVTWAMPTWLPGRVQHSGVRIDHYGYLADVVEARDKRVRNLELLMEQVATERTAFTCFNIGTEHAAIGSWAEARRWFDEALALARGEQGWTEAQFAPLMVQRTITARRCTGDAFGAIALADEAMGIWPEYTDVLFERALARRLEGDLAAAEADARAAIELGDAPARFVAVSGKGSFQARSLLASLLRERGELAAARAQLEEVVVAWPHYAAAVEELADVLLAEGASPEEADAALDALLGDRATAPTPNLRIGAVLHEAGHFDAADARYERVLASNPGHAAALATRAELRLAQGQLRDAWDVAMAVDPLDPLASRAALTAFLAAAALDAPELLAEPLERISSSELLPAPERAIYVAWRALVDPDGAIPTLVPQDPAATAAVFRNLQALIRLEATEAFEQLHALLPQVLPDERERRLMLAELYLRSRFADMAGEELIACAEQFGPDAHVLAGLGKVATMKGMWEDAEIFLVESLQLDPTLGDARRLLEAVRERVAG